LTDVRPLRGRSIARLENVTLRYGDKTVLRNCTFDVKADAVTCLIGMSGSGKSTILRLLNGLRMPSEGRVVVDGVDLATLSHQDLIDFRRQIGFSFQFAALFDSLTIGENVALPLREHTTLGKAEIEKTVLETLDLVGLADSVDRMPAELSGGMVKRAGFARAIVTKPKIILFDEPTTGLDPIITHVLTDTIIRLREQLHGTAVVVSHDLESIYALADDLAMLFEGAIVAHGTVDEMRGSPNPVVQQFLQGKESGPIPV